MTTLDDALAEEAAAFELLLLAFGVTMLLMVHGQSVMVNVVALVTVMVLLGLILITVGDGQ